MKLFNTKEDAYIAFVAILVSLILLVSSRVFVKSSFSTPSLYLGGLNFTR